MIRLLLEAQLSRTIPLIIPVMEKKNVYTISLLDLHRFNAPFALSTACAFTTAHNATLTTTSALTTTCETTTETLTPY